MGGRQGGGDGQAKSRAAAGATAGTVGAVEPLEHPGGLVGRHARPGVGHGEPGLSGLAVHRDGDRRSGRGVLHRIADQVVDDLADPPAIGVHDDRLVRVQGDPSAGLHQAGGLDGLGGDTGQVDQVEVQRRVLVELGQHQQVLHQPAHPAGFLLDERHQPQQLSPAGAVALLERELSQPPDRGQRRAQLVAGVSDEPSHPFLGVTGVRLAFLASPVGGLDPAEHRVERLGQPPDLSTGRGVVDAPGQVAGGDRRRRALDPGQWRQADPHQRQADAGQQRDGDRSRGRVSYLQPDDRAVQVAQAGRDDDMPPAGQRRDQDPPGTRWIALCGGGKRAPRAGELGGGNLRRRHVVLRAARHLDLAAGADDLDQELDRQPGLPFRAAGQARMAARAGQPVAGQHREAAELLVGPADQVAAQQGGAQRAHHHRRDGDQDRGHRHDPDPQRRIRQHGPQPGARPGSHEGGIRST